MKCSSCKGYGYEESSVYYYGRAECGNCGGIGIVDDEGKPFETQEDLESYLFDPRRSTSEAGNLLFSEDTEPGTVS